MTRRQAILAALAALLPKPKPDSFHARNVASSLCDKRRLWLEILKQKGLVTWTPKP
jgi:hypothetical protein